MLQALLLSNYRTAPKPAGPIVPRVSPGFVVKINQKVVFPLSPGRRFRHAVLLVGKHGDDNARLFRGFDEQSPVLRRQVWRIGGRIR